MKVKLGLCAADLQVMDGHVSGCLKVGCLAYKIYNNPATGMTLEASDLGQWYMVFRDECVRVFRTLSGADKLEFYKRMQNIIASGEVFNLQSYESINDLIGRLKPVSKS